MDRIINIEDLPQVFKTREIVRITHGRVSKRKINYRIKNLLKRGKLFKISKSIYSKTANIFYIGVYLYRGYIGFSSALYLHSLKTEVSSEIYVCTSAHKKKRRVLGRIIIPVNVSKQQYGAEFILVEGDEILVSTYPKTIFDMLSVPKYANYFDMYRALNERNLTKKEWEELLYYATDSSLTDVRRIGYALEGLAPAWFVKKLHKLSREGSRISYFFKHKNINYDSRWEIYDSINVRQWFNAI